MIHDIRQTVRRSQGFWRHLPYSLCSANQETLFSRVLRESRNAEIRHDSTRNTQQSRLSSSLSHKLDLDLEKNAKDNLCWNGEDSAPYNAEVIADGLTNQARNPEVSLTAIVPPEIVRDQIYKLQTITNQLKQAHRGHDVEWWDNEEVQNNRDHVDMIEIEGSGYDSSEGSGGMPYLEDDDEDHYNGGSGSGDEYPDEDCGWPLKPCKATEWTTWKPVPDETTTPETIHPRIKPESGGSGSFRVRRWSSKNPLQMVMAIGRFLVPQFAVGLGWYATQGITTISFFSSRTQTAL